MSEKLTRIRLPGQRSFRGLMDWDEKTAEAMVSIARAHSRQLREEADAIDRAADADFQIDVVRGPYVQRHIREVQKSALKNDDCELSA